MRQLLKVPDLIDTCSALQVFLSIDNLGPKDLFEEERVRFDSRKECLITYYESLEDSKPGPRKKQFKPEAHPRIKNEQRIRNHNVSKIEKVQIKLGFEGIPDVGANEVYEKGVAAKFQTRMFNFDDPSCGIPSKPIGNSWEALVATHRVKSLKTCSVFPISWPLHEDQSSKEQGSNFKSIVQVGVLSALQTTQSVVGAAISVISTSTVQSGQILASAVGNVSSKLPV